MIEKRTFTVIFLFALLALTVIYPLATFSPGFEGAKCNFHGVYVDYDWTEGGNKYHRYQDAEDPIATTTSVGFLGLGSGSAKLSWGSYATPNDAGLDLRSWGNIGFIGGSRSYPSLKIHVESNIQLQHITRQGDPDPLNWDSDDPLNARRIEFWSKKGEKVTETTDTVTYEYELTKESFLIVPSEFWVGFYLVASQNDAGTQSGWREGEWTDLTAWFMLDFHVWDNAYYDGWLQDPDAEVYTTEYNGTVISQERLISPDSYRGGFPIAGWIQGWEKADQTSDPFAGMQQSDTWYDVRGEGSGTFTDQQVAELREILMSKVEFSPGMVGQFISLYDEPSIVFDYTQASFTDFENSQALTNSISAPDTRMKKVMYFPINIENFGTHTVAHTWGLTGHTIYYPSAYFRVRMIYGVYGSFKYLWTEQVTKSMEEGGLDYPKDIERHGTTVIHTTGPLSPFADAFAGLGDWFSNPFSQIWLLFLIGLILIVIVTVLNPGLWGSLASVYKSKSRRGRKR